MQDSRTHSALPVIALVFALLLVVAGAAFFEWQQGQIELARQETLLYQEQAAALEDSLRAKQLRTSNDVEPTDAAIRRILKAQQQAWNSGDIDEFMNFYWKSDDLTFSSGGKVTRGWQATLNGYKQRYSTRQHMGVLDFSNLEITMLGRASALVLGEWKLTRDTGDIGGKFSLVLREIDGQWLIIHDHTSKGESTSASAD